MSQSAAARLVDTGSDYHLTTSIKGDMVAKRPTKEIADDTDQTEPSATFGQHKFVFELDRAIRDKERKTLLYR